VSIREIAKAVGVSAPSIYRHFADKDELVRAACDDAFEQFDRTIGAALEGAATPVEQIERLGRGYVQFGLDHPGLYRVLFMAPDFDEFDFDLAAQQPGIRTFTQLIDLLQESIDTGLLAAGDAFVMGCMFWMNIHGLVSLRLSKPTFPWPPVEDQLRMMMDTMLHGLAARS
jgi:AcrR family transcriptional regulator